MAARHRIVALRHAIKGRKIVPGWDGDLVDLTQTAAVGIVAGVCSRAVIGVATGVLKSCAVGGIVLYAAQYSGFFKLDTAKIKRSARALVGKVDLLGALEKLGFPDDPRTIARSAASMARRHATLASRRPSTSGRRTSTARRVGGGASPRPSWSERPEMAPNDHLGERRSMFKKASYSAPIERAISCCLK